MKILGKIWEFVYANWDYITPIVYEILVRLFPTKKNISLIDNGWKILNFIVKNKRKPVGDEVVTGRDAKGNVLNSVDVKIDKHILMVLLFVCMSLSAFSQNPNNQFNGMYLTDPGVNDSAKVQSTRTSLQAVNGNTGGFYFDKDRNKMKMWNGSAWVDLTVSPPLSSLISVTGTSPISVLNPTTNAVVSMTAAAAGVSGYVNTASQSMTGAKTFVTSVTSPLITASTSLTTPLITRSGNINITTVGAGTDIINTAIDDYSIVSNDAIYTIAADYTITTGGSVDIQSTTNITLTAVGALNENGENVDLSSNNSFQITALTGNAQIASANQSVILLAPNGSMQIDGNSVDITSATTTTINGDATLTGTLLFTHSIAAFSFADPTAIPVDNSNIRLLSVSAGAGSSVEVRTVASLPSQVAGSNTQVQFNNAGAFGADADFTFTGGNQLNVPIVSGPATLSLQALVGTLSLFSASGTISLQSTGETIVAPATNNSTTGYAVTLTGGLTGAAAQKGGNINITSGDGSGAGGDSGDILITAPGPTGTNGDRGNITLTTGAGSGAGARGYIIMTGLPTSCAGAPTGALANIAGVCNICP